MSNEIFDKVSNEIFDKVSNEVLNIRLNDKIIKVSKLKFLKCSLISDLLENEYSEDVEIPLYRVNEKYLNIIDKFLDLDFFIFKGPITQEDSVEKLFKSHVECSNLDSLYLLINSLNINELQELAKAADYLGLEVLIEVIAVYIACLLKNKSRYQITKLLQIENDIEEVDIIQIMHDNMIKHNIMYNRYE